MANQALFGRYWEADSVVHRLDPRTKLIGVVFMMVVAFSAGNFPALGIVVLATIAIVAFAPTVIVSPFCAALYASDQLA